MKGCCIVSCLSTYLPGSDFKVWVNSNQGLWPTSLTFLHCIHLLSWNPDGTSYLYINHYTAICYVKSDGNPHLKKMGVLRSFVIPGD